MAYVNNGTERSLKVSVYKKVGGNYVQGYPKVYDGQQSWGDVNYPTLTDIQARQLSDADFSDRLVAFKVYVESIESGADFATDVIGDGAIRSNTGVCLPTTTTTQRPVWSFAVKYSTVSNGACSGISDTLYSYSQFPVVGDILYQDSAATIPWAKGAYVLFVNPAIYGGKTVMVSVITNLVYDTGEITNTVSGYDCNNVNTTTTTIASYVTPVFLAIPANGHVLDDFYGLTIAEAISSGITDSAHVYQKYTNVSVSQLQNHTPYGYTFYNDYACTIPFAGPEEYMAVIDTGNSTSEFYYMVYVNSIGGTHLWNALVDTTT